MPRHGAARDANEPEIVEALVKCGISVVRVDEPCDLICGWHGKTTLLEVKVSEKEPLTPAQRKFSASFRGKYRVVWNAAMAVEAVVGPSRIQGANTDE
jgi:Holliday junction resolvase